MPEVTGADEAIAKCKSLLGLGDTHDVVFLQGGATQLFTTIPMNFLNGTADYLVGGEWSKKAVGAAKDIKGLVRQLECKGIQPGRTYREYLMDKEELLILASPR